MTDEQINELATKLFGNNSATEHFQAWCEGFKYAKENYFGQILRKGYKDGFNAATKSLARSNKHIQKL